MADRNLPGEADNHVEAERGDAEDADLNEQTEAVLVQKMRRKADQCDPGNHHIAAGFGRKHGGVRGIAGAEIAGGDKGLACHD